MSVLDRFFQVVLLVATASAVFAIGLLLASSWRGGDAPVDPGAVAITEPTEPTIEIRLTSTDVDDEVFAGQPVIVHVELINLRARRTRRQAPIDPANDARGDELRLDDRSTPWEHRLLVDVTGDDGQVITRLEPTTHLLDPHPVASGRRLGLAPARTIIVIEGSDLARATPGPILVGATLPPEMMPPDRVRTVPLSLELRPAPTNDPDRAAISLAVATVASLRGEAAAAIEAGLTTLTLDPLQDEALRIIAESWEQQGELERALEWYDRYLETISDADERAALHAYVEALRRQR